MMNYLIYLIFILSVALAAGGVVLSSRLRNRYHHDLFSSLLYYQVFIYTFGFYGIWGQAVIRVYFSAYISTELLSRFTEFALFIGMPFLVFAWLMLIRFSYSISGRNIKKWFAPWFLFINFSVFISVGYIIARSGSVTTFTLITGYFIFMNFLYTLFSSILILFPGRTQPLIHEYYSKIIAPSIFLIMLAQCALLILFGSRTLIAIIFILAFFGGNIFLPLYLNYGTLLSSFTADSPKQLSLEEFCRKYEISPRETDIIREICNGLSNKEIGNKLFISLQTVKDHTHRIYIKTNVKSRVQLINLVKDTMANQGL
jgi:DNA-binding CsgD family transcriptional regulator